MNTYYALNFRAFLSHKWKEIQRKNRSQLDSSCKLSHLIIEFYYAFLTITVNVCTCMLATLTACIQWLNQLLLIKCILWTKRSPKMKSKHITSPSYRMYDVYCYCLPSLKKAIGTDHIVTVLAGNPVNYLNYLTTFIERTESLHV